jgi:hypothetical protein
MIIRTLTFIIALLAVVPAYAGVNDIQVLEGKCNKSSHTAEGPIDADLTKRQSRFYCDSASITFFDDYKGHVIVQFSQREAHHTPILSFS